jgi:DNA (cytosine-5)-methyltransferase 1
MPKSVKKSAKKPFVPFVDDYSRNCDKNLGIVDLFAGIGGFHYGIGAAANEFGLGVETLLVSELEKSCREVYELNHGNPSSIHGDVNQIPLHRVAKAEADLVTAGFPCQPFSNSGRKLGLNDPRGQFYERIEEIIKAFNAKAFILENVPGMTKNGGKSVLSELSMAPNQIIGATMQTLEQAMKAGLQSSRIKKNQYHIKWLEINSSHVGSPQVRKRVYIIGLRKDLGEIPDLLQISEDANRTTFIDIAETDFDIRLTLSKNQEKNVRSFMKKNSPPSYKDGMRRVGQAYLCEGGNVGQAYHAHGMVPTLTKVWARFLPIYFPTQNELLPSINDPDFIPGQGYGKGQIRRASVREVMRLQGFPDTFTPHERDSDAYQQAGNAVNALVVKQIVTQLLPLILKK